MTVVGVLVVGAGDVTQLTLKLDSTAAGMFFKKLDSLERCRAFLGRQSKHCWQG